MKILLTERKYRIPLGNNGSRRRYLEKLIAQINNELAESALSPVDRARFYNSLLTAIKTVHEIDSDSKLEELMRRIEALESKGK